MINLYCGTSSQTSRQAIAWFDDNKIKIKKKKIEQISRSDLVHILKLSENGFFDILKSSQGSGTRVHALREHIKYSNFNEAVDCLMEHLDILRVPIIFDENRLIIGYNPESIRTFVPKEHRRNKILQNKL